MAAGQGPCTSATAGVLCASGLCNPVTLTCGGASGSTCTTPNQCVTNICALNNECGNPNNGACTTGTDCQSGACSTNGHTCIPPGGCANTSDCSTGQVCNTSTLGCEIPPGITTSAGTTQYLALASDVAIDPALTVQGTQPIIGATVTIGAGYVPSQDSLVFAPMNGITGSYSSTTGVLTLTGSASSAQYQAALATVQYHNSAGALPDTTLRTITFGIGTAVANGTNGHFYEYVSAPNITWTAAKAAAAARSYLGLRGYLVSITTPAENAFITQKLSNDGWMGGQASGLSFPRTWSWVGGPEAGEQFCNNSSSGVCSVLNGLYANWAGGEPNNSGNNEACGQIYFASGGTWNDLPCTGAVLAGYVVEYGDSPGDPTLTLTASKDLQIVAAASLTITASTQTASLHDSVTFTANISPSSATGTIQFFVDGVAVGSPITDSGGIATFTTVDLTLGSHAITASYSGDPVNQPANGSMAGSITINPMANGTGPCDTIGAVTDCASGVCSSTGVCGYGNNEGPCTPGGSTQCQSGSCSLGGACEPVGGCYIDSDCTGMQYCDRSSDTCAALLGVNAPLPNDGLHDGTCAVGGMSSLCASGQCNSVTNTCSQGNSSTCTVAAACTSNACSPSGYCVPSMGGGCYADSDCMMGSYCNRAVLTCTSTLPSGSAIPVDGLHDGTCAATNMSTTCATGLCNTTTNTCAGPIGAACTGASQCEYGTCSSGKCGFSDGDPGCSTQTAYLCCSPARAALRATAFPRRPTGCFVDADCSASQYCDRANLACVSKGVSGAALPDDGKLHDGVCAQALAQAACVSGTCNAVTNTCADANGVVCTVAGDCVTDFCGTNGQCGQANGDGPCNVMGGTVSCQSGVCNASANGSASACVPTGGCYVDSDCASGQYCARSTFTCMMQVIPGGPIVDDGLHPVCGASHISAECSTGLCNADTNTCASDLSQGCMTASDCVSDVCGSNAQCGEADGQAGCTTATAASICQSGSCTPSGVCAPGGGCFLDSDCHSGQYCDRATLTCSAQLAAGSAIPDDGLHDGKCDATGPAVCATHACNATTNTCAGANDADCGSAAQCTGNVCGTNDKCGYADGQAGCTAATASSCQSGSCSVEGVCKPSTATGCWADADLRHGPALQARHADVRGERSVGPGVAERHAARRHLLAEPRHSSLRLGRVQQGDEHVRFRHRCHLHRRGRLRRRRLR